jgi:hypothetical protein
MKNISLFVIIFLFFIIFKSVAFAQVNATVLTKSGKQVALTDVSFNTIQGNERTHEFYFKGESGETYIPIGSISRIVPTKCGTGYVANWCYLTVILKSGNIKKGGSGHVKISGTDRDGLYVKFYWADVKEVYFY